MPYTKKVCLQTHFFVAHFMLTTYTWKEQTLLALQYENLLAYGISEWETFTHVSNLYKLISLKKNQTLHTSLLRCLHLEKSKYKNADLYHNQNFCKVKITHLCHQIALVPSHTLLTELLTASCSSGFSVFNSFLSTIAFVDKMGRGLKFLVRSQSCQLVFLNSLKWSLPFAWL